MDADMFNQMFNGAQMQSGGAPQGDAGNTSNNDTTDVPFEEVK
jgi:hypothetical protein